jgi:hypothetical protein
MKEINIKKQTQADCLLKQIPKQTEFDEIIKEDTKILFNGEPVAIYINVPKHLLVGMRAIAKNTKFQKTQRTWGLPTQSSVFGALPRNPLRHDRCRFSGQSVLEKENFANAFEFGQHVGQLYAQHLPEAYRINKDLVEQNIHADWLPTEQPFTTCNFNINHAIKHHRDTGNFKNVFSNVLILKEGILGGLLVFPELRIAFEQSDGALGIFDGQRWMHGVTPITRIEKTGYRASIVFYALDGMRHCYPYKAEAQRFAKVKTTRATQRAKGNPVLKTMIKKNG